MKSSGVLAVLASIIVVLSAFAFVAPSSSPSISGLSGSGYGLNNGSSSAPTQQIHQATGTQSNEEYLLTFIENGLPSGSLWSVDINNRSFVSNSTEISVSLGGGDYNYSLTDSVGLLSPEQFGALLVSNNMSVSVDFVGKLVSPEYVNFWSGSISSSSTSVAPSQNYVYSIYDAYSGYILIASYSNSTLLMINASTLKLVHTVQLAESPNGMAVNPANGEIYVSSLSTVFAVNVNGIVQWSIQLPTTSGKAVEYDPSTGQIYFGTTCSGTFVIQNKSGTPSVFLHFSSTDVLSSQGLRYDSATGYLLIADRSNGTVDFLNDNKFVKEIKTYLPPISILVVPGTDRIFYTSFSGSSNTKSIYYIEGESTVSVNVSGKYIGLAYDPVINAVIASSFSNSLAIINAAYPYGTLLKLQTSSLVYAPIYDPGNGSIFLANEKDYLPEIYPLTDRPHTITFISEGLKAGTTWGISLNSYRVMSSTGTLTMTELPGNYQYSVIEPQNYTSVPGGSVTVASQNVTATIAFIELHSVVFHESGLPAGTEWKVILSNQTYHVSGTSIYFNLTNGTYEYSVPAISPYEVTFSSGLLLVSGSETLNFTFSSSLHSVTFASVGLQGSTPWQVSLGDIFVNSTGNRSVSVSVSPGDYIFNLSHVAGFRTSTYEIPVTVSGSNVQVTINWTAVTYPVIVKESGLPPGYAWELSALGHTYSTASDSMTVEVPNGTFQLAAFLANGTFRSPGALAVIDGTGASYTVSFSPVLFNVTFDETGLPSATEWELLKGSTTLAVTSTDSMVLHLANGTYHFYGYPRTEDYRGTWVNFTVSGADLSVSLAFSAVFINITVQLSGYLNGLDWELQLFNGQNFTFSSNSSIISIMPGEYSYSAAPLSNKWSGTTGILNTTISSFLNITFGEVTFVVTFVPENITSGWQLSIANTSYNSLDNGSVSVELQNGSYGFIAYASTSYQAFSGNITVNGSDESFIVSFQPVLYRVEFREDGLHDHTLWYLNLSNGMSFNTTHHELSVFLTNGTYSFVAVSSDPRFGNVTGSVVVNGNQTCVKLPFRHVEFRVAFFEKGLERGQSWGVSVQGNSYYSNADESIVIYLRQGNYTYFPSVVNGSISIYEGYFTVTKHSVNVRVYYVNEGEFPHFLAILVFVKHDRVLVVLNEHVIYEYILHQGNVLNLTLVTGEAEHQTYGSMLNLSLTISNQYFSASLLRWGPEPVLLVISTYPEDICSIPHLFTPPFQPSEWES